MIIMDLHNHTTWSDGKNTIDELIKHAILIGINVLGFSDHFNNLKPSIPFDHLEYYINELDEYKEKYKNRITILKALEIDLSNYPKCFTGLNLDLIKKLDYVLIEYIEELLPDLELEHFGKLLNKLSIPVGLAHTDLVSLFKKCKNNQGIDNIYQFLQKYKIFYEINVNKAYGFFNEVLYNNSNPEIADLKQKIKQYNIKVSVGSDCHSLNYFSEDKLFIGNAIAKILNKNTLPF